MLHQFFFQHHITTEQIALADTLVDYSLKHHPITDIFAKDPNGKERQREFRHTGTLGEIVFADTYQLPRPSRAFGAIDGQDFGQDFVMPLQGRDSSFDIKTMRRNNNNFRTNYVLNLPAYQMHRPNLLTDYYFCVSIHTKGEQHIASFLGYVSKKAVELGNIGILYNKGTRRIKDNGDSFVFQRDTYEVEFKDISTPPLPPQYQQLIGFEKRVLKAAF